MHIIILDSELCLATLVNLGHLDNGSVSYMTTGRGKDTHSDLAQIKFWTGGFFKDNAANTFMFETLLETSPCAGSVMKTKSSPLYSFLLKEAGLGEAWLKKG